MAAPLNINANILSNPTHPAHDVAARHLGAALGHALTGNAEGMAQHLHAMVDQLMVPHREAAGAQQPVAATSQQPATPVPVKKRTK